VIRATATERESHIDLRPAFFRPAVEHPRWQQWIDRAFEEDMRPYGVQFALHHYVGSFNSLMSILSSETLWASDVRCLNDSTEFDHGLPTCLHALDSLRSPSLRAHVDLIGQGLRERFRHQTFVACFSTSNNLRSQWEEYADKGRGFVVTFDNLVLTALAPPNGIRLMPVEYGKAVQALRAQRSVARAVEDIEATPPEVADREWTIRSRFTMLATEMFFLCTSFKSADWRPECEWRMIYSRQRRDVGPLDVRTRIGRWRLIPYVVLNLRQRYAQHAAPSFSAVRAGPRVSDAVAELVQRYLREFAPHTTWERQPRF
jgi:hypothetical protein